MAFIVAPDFAMKQVDWRLNAPAQVNVGAYTGIRQVVANPWFTQWSATVTLAQQQGEAGFRKLRSFFAKARGSINTFRLYATPEAQNSNLNVSVASNAAQGATSLQITGYLSPLTEGQFFTVHGQLCVCTADQSSQTLTFVPPLRAAANAGTPVVTSRPYALVALSNPQQAWTETPYRLFNASFDVTEAILETDGVTVPESELVTNGTFTTNTSGWVGAFGGTLSVVSGHLRVTNGSASTGAAEQVIAVIPGKTYLVQWDSLGGTAPPDFIVSDGVVTLIDSGAVGSSLGATVTTAQSSLTIIPLTADAVAGHYTDWDNISVREA